MKTKLLTAVIAAFSLIAALFPSRSQAEYTIPSWEQVGVYYGYYLQSYNGDYSYPGSDPNLMLQSLYNTYGANVAYYFYFKALSENLSTAVHKEQNTFYYYYNYLARYYANLYYYIPEYSSQLYFFYTGYASNQYNYYNSYEFSATEYYDDASEYYYFIIFPS